jgi:hypothetical protein
MPTTNATRIARQIGIYLHNMGQAEDAMVWARRSLTYAEAGGDAREIALSLNVIGINDWTAGHRELGSAVLNLAVDVARKNQLVFELGMPLLNIAAFTLNQDPAGALAAAEQAYVLWEQGGNLAQAWNTVANQATALAYLGRWDELAAMGNRPLLQQLAPAAAEESLLNFVLAHVALARAEPLDRPKLERLAANWEPGQLESLDDMLFIACAAALARETGDEPSLVTLCRPLVASAFKHVGLEDDFPPLWNRAVQWTIEVGDLDAARDLLRCVAEAPEARLNPMLAAELPRLRGTIEAADPGSSADPAAIEHDLLDAITALDGLGVVPDRARAQAALGRWLIGQGRAADAEPHLHAARQTFAELRADAWLRELDGAPPLSVAG